MEDAFMKSADECVGYFGVDAERGLSQRQVEDNRKKYGPNGELKTIQQLIPCAFSHGILSIDFS